MSWANVPAPVIETGYLTTEDNVKLICENDFDFIILNQFNGWVIIPEPVD